MTTHITDDQIDQLGRIIDEADNLLQAATMQLPTTIHADQLCKGLARIRNSIHDVYVELLDADSESGGTTQ